MPPQAPYVGGGARLSTRKPRQRFSRQASEERIMTIGLNSRRLGGLALTAAMLLGSQLGATAGAAQEREHEHDRMGRPGVRADHGMVLDGRYNHGHYYPAIGSSLRVLPEGYHPYYWHGAPYYFYGGIWYAPGGPGFLVIRPPAGLVISALPPYYTTVWIGGPPYYYANDVYYTWNAADNGYAVVAPPANAEQPSAPPSAQEDLIIYPKNGQTNEKQAADRFECHSWAKSQTGFDPTQPGGGVAPGAGMRSRDGYNRAMAACLTARGYEVK
jgi:hypothetical protein